MLAHLRIAKFATPVASHEAVRLFGETGLTLAFRMDLGGLVHSLARGDGSRHVRGDRSFEVRQRFV
jgi:hypothetical protein